MARLGVTEGEKVYHQGNEVKDKLKKTENEVTRERRGVYIEGVKRPPVDGC